MHPDPVGENEILEGRWHPAIDGTPARVPQDVKVPDRHKVLVIITELFVPMREVRVEMWPNPHANIEGWVGRDQAAAE